MVATKEKLGAMHDCNVGNIRGPVWVQHWLKRGPSMFVTSLTIGSRYDWNIILSHDKIIIAQYFGVNITNWWKITSKLGHISILIYFTDSSSIGNGVGEKQSRWPKSKKTRYKSPLKSGMNYMFRKFQTLVSMFSPSRCNTICRYNHIKSSYKK